MDLLIQIRVAVLQGAGFDRMLGSLRFASDPVVIRMN
jgi:hypothetical protein